LLLGGQAANNRTSVSLNREGVALSLARVKQKIPWDFLGPYHAVPHYWIEAARLGVPVSWIPFQAMGYPIYLNLQSGLFYPPYWWFVVTGTTYTVDAAILMQGMHVLFGAVGATLCARLLNMRWALALLAAVVYQSFGGFYSHASHPDIVRAYALLPWLCAPVIAPWQDGRLFRLSVGLMPLWSYGLWTGGYSGGAIAVSFVLVFLLAGRTIASRGDRSSLICGGLIGLALFSGALLAGFSLLPTMLDRAEVTRVGASGFLSYEYLDRRDWLALIWRIEGDFFGHDVTMRALFIGLPALSLFLLRLQLGRLREGAPLFAMALLALAMVSGVLHQPAMKLLPPLGYSRYIIADYRALLALPMILMGIQAAHLVAQGATGPRPWRHTWWLLTVAFAVGVLVLMLDRSTLARSDVLAGIFLLCALGGALALVAAWIKISPKPSRGPVAMVLLAGLGLITVADWTRVHWMAPYFQSAGARTWLQTMVGTPERAQVALRERLTSPTACRPARVDVPATRTDQVAWRGYHTGEYMAQDATGPAHLARFQRIVQNSSLYAFALKPWTALTLPPEAQFTAESMTEGKAVTVRCQHYGTTRIEYEVDLEAPTRVVENEVFWPGWTAQINGQKITAFDAHDMRAWNLPAGRYKMVATFESPHRTEALLSGLFGLLVWLGLVTLLIRGRPE
jgi:hypothetical protein